MTEQTRKDVEPRVGGVRLRVRFALLMTVALAIVMIIAGFLIYSTTARLISSNQEQAYSDALHYLNASLEAQEYEQVGTEAVEFDGGRVRRFNVRYGKDRSKSGYLYQLTSKKENKVNLVTPAVAEKTGKDVLGLIIGIIVAVIGVGALVAFSVGNQVSRPLEQIVEDIRHVSRGDLGHRTRTRGGGEIALLAKSVERMKVSLSEAHEAQVELSVRERELEVAGEVREALLPERTPQLPGFDLGATHFGSPTPGGDFYDFLELKDGRVGLLICEVSGRGIPGALIGATARSYLRLELSRNEDIADALRKVNREVARDVRRGMYVTAMYALLDPATGTLKVACAGHKLPLLRYTSADKKIRIVQPEGIALGFDKGPVFDKTLKLTDVPLAPGDRILMANTGAVSVQNPDGDEMGEKSFYRAVLQYSSHPTPKLLQLIERTMQQFAQDTPYPSDIAMVTVAREG